MLRQATTTKTPATEQRPRAVIYARVGTVRTDQDTMEQQREMCRQTVAQLGATTKRELTDQGCSTTPLDGSAYQACIAYVRTHQVDYLGCRDITQRPQDQPVILHTARSSGRNQTTTAAVDAASTS
mgnify:CR=1 FL=1